MYINGILFLFLFFKDRMHLFIIIVFWCKFIYEGGGFVAFCKVARRYFPHFHSSIETLECKGISNIRFILNREASDF